MKNLFHVSFFALFFGFPRIAAVSPNDDPQVYSLATQMVIQLELALVLVCYMKDISNENDSIHHLQLANLNQLVKQYSTTFYKPQVLKHLIPNCRLDVYPAEVDIRQVALFAYRKEANNPWLERVDLRRLDFNLFPDLSGYRRIDYCYLRAHMPQIISRISSNLPIFRRKPFSAVKVRQTVDKLLMGHMTAEICHKIRTEFDPRFDGNFNKCFGRYNCSHFRFGMGFDYSAMRRAYIHFNELQFSFK